MAIRIYALSKDLKIDSKELVDICTKAGVPGKGSALASLTEEEVARVKAYLTGGTRATRPAPVPVPSGPPPILPPVTAASLAAAAAPPAPTPAPVAPPVGPTPPPLSVVRPATPVAPVPAPPAAPLATTAAQLAQPPAQPNTFSRDDYIAPTGGSGGIRIIDSRGKRLGGEKKKPEGDEPRGPAVRKEPSINIKLAAVPRSSQPVLEAKSQEPAAQRPIMVLPKEAIRTAKAGTRPPLEHLTRTAEKNRAAQPTSPQKPGQTAATSAKTPAASPLARDAGRRKVGRPIDLEEAEKADLADMASARAVRQKNRTSSKKIVIGEEEDDDAAARRKKLIRKGTNTAAPRKDRAVVELPCTVRKLSEATGVGNMQIQKVLMGMGIMANINAVIEPETATLIATELGLNVEFRKPISLEEKVLKAIDEIVDDPASLEKRPPVVTFLGHVDHGKTSLLDYLIGTNVVAGEAGGITQHIRAYQIKKDDGRQISFVDTPGHEAFTEMRARGANVTDIAVLVVAADDGVMPQTEEALSHARAAKVPIVVALNKMDLPGADPNRVMQQLAAQNLLVTEWGGDVEMVKVSALKGTGMNDLLETLLLTADIHDLKANPKRAAIGTCLESSQQAGRGVVAKLIVRNGTLRVGDIIVCGAAHGRIKAMHATLAPFDRVDVAGPSCPVDITGLDVPPSAGDKFYVLSDIAQAREIAAVRAAETRETSLSGRTIRVSFEEFQRRLQDGQLQTAEESVTLNLIIRADTRGSIEALQSELAKLDHPEVKLSVLQASVGGVTVADVTLADASDAVIVSFNVIPDDAARSLAEAKGVEIRRYDIIYKVSDDIKALLEGRLKPEERMVELGRVLVKQVFSISRVGTVAGCQVMDGTAERSAKARVYRDGRVIGEYPLDTLRREKDDVRSVAKGLECGIKLANFNDIKVGDILELYKIEEFARTFN